MSMRISWMVDLLFNLILLCFVSFRATFNLKNAFWWWENLAGYQIKNRLNNTFCFLLLIGLVVVAPCSFFVLLLLSVTSRTASLEIGLYSRHRVLVVSMYCAYDTQSLAIVSLSHSHSSQPLYNFFPSNIFRINVFLIWLVLMVSNEAHTQNTPIHKTSKHRASVKIYMYICIQCFHLVFWALENAWKRSKECMQQANEREKHITYNQSASQPTNQVQWSLVRYTNTCTHTLASRMQTLE